MKTNSVRLLFSAVLAMCCMSVWAEDDWTIIEQPTCSQYGTMQHTGTGELRLVPKLAHQYMYGVCTECNHKAPTPYSGTPATSLVTITDVNYADYGLTDTNRQCVMGWKVISTAEEFMRYINHDGSLGSYILFNAFLAEDIVLDSTVGLPETSLDKNCIFDGTGHTVSNVYRSGEGSYVGLFHNNRGIIRNLGLISPRIEVGGSYAGCICDNNFSTIENCFVVDGVIDGTGSDLNGIACQNNGGTIINCYAITNKGNVGRTTIGTITNSYGATTGSVPDDFYATALSGLNGSKVNGVTWYHSSASYPVMMPSMTHTPGTATCTAAGNREYWQCTVCNKYFLDVSHTHETSLAPDELSSPALGHILLLKGNNAHCVRCNQYFSDIVATNNKPALLTRKGDAWFLETKDGFTLQDGVNYLSTADFFVEGHFHYRRDLSAVKEGAWQCWYEPFDLQLTTDVLAKMDVAEVAGVLLDNEGNTVVAFRKIDSGWMDANTPYAIRPTDAEGGSLELEMFAPQLYQSEETSFYTLSAYDKFTFGGNYSAQHNDRWYTLNTSGEFQRMKTGVNLKGQRFWMTITPRGNDAPYGYGGAAATREYIHFTVLGDDEATGIETIDNGQWTIDNSQLYDLQGRKVTSIQSGQVYIMNGKKYQAR